MLTIKDIINSVEILLFMNILKSAVVLLIILSFTVPAVSADGENRYSYITIDSVDLELTKDKAIFDVNYHIDNGVEFLVIFLGKNDLKNKLEKMFSLGDADFGTTTMESTRMTLNNPSVDYGDGSYWFPKKTFQVTVPVLNVKTARSDRTFYNVNEVPGMGYFGDPLPATPPSTDINKLRIESEPVTLVTPEPTPIAHYFR